MLESSETTSDPVLESASQDIGQALPSMALKLPLRPTPAYLAIAHSSSHRAPLPHVPRKLLILDLNGTLLLRPKPRNAKHRPVHPRPYMPAFRSYLFHEAVKPWLDVMVWSSAQPHSVDNMVERCFVDRRDELKAVWARDMLDLDADSYSRKVQTTKDLEKPWSLLDLLDSQSHHSAETTILLDDSPLKAHLQPYNHFCVPEYTKNLRNRDLSVKKAIEENNSKLVDKPMMLTTGTVFDPTLLAVIGVLEGLKEQTNVAGWIRAGALWAGETPPPRDESSTFELFSDSDGSRIDTRGGNSGNDAVEAETMWFDHMPCFEYWEDRGRCAVETLGIEMSHGIDR